MDKGLADTWPRVWPAPDRPKTSTQTGPGARSEFLIFLEIVVQEIESLDGSAIGKQP